MGRLNDGPALHWSQISKELVNKFKNSALEKFIQHFLSPSSSVRPALFGDEIEYNLMKFDNGRAELLFEYQRFLPSLSERWHWEVYLCQGESTPPRPFGVKDVHRVEACLRSRRQELQAFMTEHERVKTVCVWPSLRSGENTAPPYEESETSSRLKLVTPTNRYKGLCENIFYRSLGPVVSVPVFPDKRTRIETVEVETYNIASHLSALQTTLQPKDFVQARNFYDQFAALAPVLVALTAAGPCFKSLLLDTDCRSALQVSNDLTESATGLPSRWSSVRHYISARGGQYNDVVTAVNQEAYQDLVRAGVDPGLALHAAFRLNYDPVIVYDNNDHVDAAEVMNGTVWQLVKLKLPEDLNSWLIEVRMMDVQISDFENAAFILLVYLISRAIDTYDLEFYIPVSELFDNIDKSLKRDAVLNEKFMFRCSSTEGIECDKEEMSVDDIMNGNDRFSGILHFLYRYLEEAPELNGNEQPLSKEKVSVESYMKFLSRRASGEERTNARKIRDFISRHPDYKSDSVICDTVLHDLMRETDKWEK